jgi:hypothetical protein
MKKMKILFTLIISCFLATLYAQNVEFDTLFEKGKAEFKKDFLQQDFQKAVNYLEKAVSLKPDNAEARYFLGYAYNRVNSKQGESIIDMSLLTLIRASEQFEKVNKLTPKYTGEIIAYDPYSIISFEWGSIALRYLYLNKTDSAIWAFKEGKRRGGFGDYMLSINKEILDACSKNAILVTCGDFYTFPLLYQQIIKHYRKDVLVIDVMLLNTSWYPKYLSINKLASFDMPDQTLDTIKECLWPDSTITINGFSWLLKSAYSQKYILRGDRILLSLLKANNFQRDIYFTIGFDEDYRLCLKNYLTSYFICDKLNVGHSNAIAEYENSIKGVLSISKYINRNSPDEMRMFDYFRNIVLNRTYNYLKMNDKGNAKRLIGLLDKYASEKEFPYLDENSKKYADYLRQQI